jgi:hypothetical protein
VIALPGTAKNSPSTVARGISSRHFVGAPVSHAPQVQAGPSARLLSFLRDDIFDTFHSTRSRWTAGMPDDLFSELAAEFAGVE